MTGEHKPTDLPGSERLRAALTKVRAAWSAAWHGFRHWRRTRPFWGGLLIVLSGLEVLASTQLSLGNLQIRIGLEGLQAVLIPVILITAGLLIWFMPVHRVFYGVIALVVALYSLVGVNFGGFFFGMLLGILGGSLAIAWSPRRPNGDPSPTDEPDEQPAAESATGAWDDLRQRSDAQSDSIVPGMRDDRGTTSVRLAMAGAASGALIVAAIVPAGATNPFFVSQTAEDCEPDPEPTDSPDPTPDPTGTPSPDPSSTPDPDATATSEPGLVEGIVSTLAQILEPTVDGCEPADDPTAGPTPEPDDEPTPGTGGVSPEDGDEETTEDEPADELDELGLPEGFELPEDAELTTERTLENDDLPVVASSPGRLSGSSITMTSLVYEGNVDIPTADGPLTVMKFTMDKSVVADFALAVDAMGDTLLTTTDELTIRGDVTFYTDRFVGRLLGFKFTFLPETPPPFTLPIMVFTDPEIRLVAVEADVLTAPIMNQRPID